MKTVCENGMVAVRWRWNEWWSVCEERETENGKGKRGGWNIDIQKGYDIRIDEV